VRIVRGDRVLFRKNDWTVGVEVANGDTGSVIFADEDGVPLPVVSRMLNLPVLPIAYAQGHDSDGTSAPVAGAPRSSGNVLIFLVVTLADGRTVAIPEAGCRHLQLGYAVTAHSAQGGEWPIVIGVVDQAHAWAAQRRMIYTMLTRAAQALYLVGQWNALHDAVQDRRQQRRSTLTGTEDSGPLTSPELRASDTPYEPAITLHVESPGAAPDANPNNEPDHPQSPSDPDDTSGQRHDFWDTEIPF
jgi:hypothetical protein